jgi:hypothetical protein
MQENTNVNRAPLDAAKTRAVRLVQDAGRGTLPGIVVFRDNEVRFSKTMAKMAPSNAKNSMAAPNYTS